jgi:hypothetical protein
VVAAERREGGASVGDGDGEEGCGAVGEDGRAASMTTMTTTTNEEREREREELRMNREALEMLPNHVVAALRARYETSDGLLALSRTLEDEAAATEEDCDGEEDGGSTGGVEGGTGGAGEAHGGAVRRVPRPAHGERREGQGQ